MPWCMFLLLSTDAREFTQSLVPFLEQSLNNLRQRIDTVLPDLHQTPAEWFQFWDEVRRRHTGRHTVADCCSSASAGLIAD